eukprot:5456356-Pyramimonas_sp.AAC.1
MHCVTSSRSFQRFHRERRDPEATAGVFAEVVPAQLRETLVYVVQSGESASSRPDPSRSSLAPPPPAA